MGVGSGGMQRVAYVADELKASDFVDEGETLAATFVVLGERAAGARVGEGGRGRSRHIR